MSLEKVFYDPKHAAVYRSVAKLGKSSKNKNGDVEEYMAGQNTNSLHKPVRKRFHRNPYTVTNFDDIWEMDLADLGFLSKHNDKHKYLLNVIDIFSRYAWSVSLKDKTCTSIMTAFKSLFQNRNPITLQLNKGTEFVNTNVQQYLKRQGVDFHTTHNPAFKGAFIECFNRTLKTKMFKYFTKNNTYRYFDFINKLLTSYNSFHSTIDVPPSKVNPSNIYSVWKKIYSLRVKIPQGRVKLKVGGLVKITKEKVKFAKWY
jgi:hypothetical protein